MKKTVIIAILLIAIGLQFSARAQSQYYYKVGDTIRGRDTIYHYQWWSEQWLSDTTHRLEFINYYTYGYDYHYYDGFGPYLRYCYTETPLKIVGLAGCIEVQRPYPYAAITDENPEYDEYLLLYDAQTDDFPLIGSALFVNVEPVRYMDIDLRSSSYFAMYPMNDEECCDTIAPDLIKTLPVHEYYFDKPVTVYDSFYVGMTKNTSYGCYPSEWNIPEFFTHAYSIGFDTLSPSNCTQHCEPTPTHLYKYKRILWTTTGSLLASDTNWHWAESIYYTLIFPIIEIDSFYGPPQYVCPGVENFHIGALGDRSAVLLWQSHNDHLRWEVSYGPEGTAPEDGSKLIAAIPAIQIAGLDSCTHYSAYIRAVCMHDSLHYSEWSEPLDICLCDTGGGASIEMPLLDQLTYLMPNPAADQVQVLSSYGMTRVEAYSLQGMKMADLRVRGLSATLDVSRWPRGMYIIVIHTPAGNVTKKLAVGR